MIKITFEDPVVIELKPAKSHSDKALSERVERLVAHEADVNIALLLDLNEFSNRKLHIDAGYPNMFQYLTKHLKITKSVAWLRFQAMKAIVDCPSLQDSIREGKVNLSTIAKTQSFLEQTEKARKKKATAQASVQTVSPILPQAVSQFMPEISPEISKDVQKNPDQESAGATGSSIVNSGKIELAVKRDLFEKISGKSVKETETLFADLGPALLGEDPQKPQLTEKEKPLPLGHKQITIVADPELVELLTRLKEVTSHQGQGTYVELLKTACRLALQKLDPMEKAKRAQARKEKGTTRSAPSAPVEPGFTKNLESADSKLEPKSAPKRHPEIKPERKGKSSQIGRYIPAARNHELWLKDGPTCQKVDPVTGQRCGSRIRVQRQHMIPFARGSDHTQLKIYCKVCNLQAAIQGFGPSVMKTYLGKVMLGGE